MFSDEIKNRISKVKNEHKEYLEKKQNKRKLLQLKAKLHDMSGRSYYEDYRVFIKDKGMNELIKSFDIKGIETLMVVCSNEQVLRSFVSVFYRLTKKVHKKTYNVVAYGVDSIDDAEPPENTAVLVFEMGRYTSLTTKQKELILNKLVTLSEVRKPLNMPTIIVSTEPIEELRLSGAYQVINIGPELLSKYKISRAENKVNSIKGSVKLEGFDPQND